MNGAGVVLCGAVPVLFADGVAGARGDAARRRRRHRLLLDARFVQTGRARGVGRRRQPNLLLVRADHRQFDRLRQLQSVPQQRLPVSSLFCFFFVFFFVKKSGFD